MRVGVGDPLTGRLPSKGKAQGSVPRTGDKNNLTAVPDGRSNITTGMWPGHFNSWPRGEFLITETGLG